MMKESIVTIGLNCTSSSCDNLTTLIDATIEPLYIYDKLPNIILISTYVPLFFIALISNLLVIIVVSRYRCLRSVTNYFLVNLSVADLLVTVICMPMAVGQSIYSLWLYGDVMCKLTHYLQGVSASASVFTITAMSIDRYMAIRHPMSRKIINRRTTRKVIFVIWCLALVVFSPILYIRRSEGFQFYGDSRQFLYCVERWPELYYKKTFGTFCFLVVYLLPGTIVVLAYSLMGLRLCSRQLLPEYEITHGPPGGGNLRGEFSGHSTNSSWQVSAVGGRLIRERRRVAKILLLLALVFAFCWLPYSVLTLIMDMNDKEPPSPDEELGDIDAGGDVDEQLMQITSLLLPFAVLLGHSQAAVNPLLYCLLSKNFRRSVTDLIRHPTRAIRSRQQCKIRMTFRKDPLPSVEPNSIEKPMSSRPRNHHAPDPPPVHKTSPCNTGVIVEQGDIRLGEMGSKVVTFHNGNNGNNHHETVVAYSPSPSSSGYSSFRGSENSHCCNQCSQQYQTMVVSTSASSSQMPSCNLFSHGNGNVNNCFVNHCAYSHLAPSVCVQCQGQSTALIFGKRGCQVPDSSRKVDVPSTIKEESENSFLSQRSKSNASMKVCFG